MDDGGLPEDTASCMFLVRFLAFFASVLFEDELDALPLREEEFFILRRSVDDEKDLLKMIVERSRICFVVKVLRTDV